MKKTKIQVENFEYSFTAFFFTFAYYLSRYECLVGTILMLIMSVVPLKDYFLVGLLVGYLATNKLKPKREKSTALGILLGCLSVVLFCLLKMGRYYLFGSL